MACTSAVLITLGTGVGGGVILNDRVYSGFNDAGSELGHMVICMDGEPCTCGRQGCFEAYASAAALIRQTEQAMAEYPDSLLYEETTDEGRVTGRTAFNAMKRGDAVAIGVVERYIRYIGEGLANIINVLMPEMIILGGGISNEGDHFLQRVKKATIERSFLHGNVEKPNFQLAALGNDAGIVGAALFARDCLQDGLPG